MKNSEFTNTPLLLDGFPLLRSRQADDVCARMSRLFSPHHLQVSGDPDKLQVQLNQVPLSHLSIHVLRYGAEVTIDPGERGNFYMLQLPLQGKAELRSGNQHVEVNRQMLSVLHPGAPTWMQWSADCAMILLCASRQVIEQRLGPTTKQICTKTPFTGMTASRHNPQVACWWQSAEDMVRNLDAYAQVWLNHSAATATMEDFLLSAFTALIPIEDRDVILRATTSGTSLRTLHRAKEFIHAHLDQSLLLSAIAAHAHVCTRTLELVFKRYEGVSPLTYARQQRLLAVHQLLHQGRVNCVTEAMLSHGFLHAGRFAALYRQQFGCPPSHTLRANKNLLS